MNDVGGSPLLSLPTGAGLGLCRCQGYRELGPGGGFGEEDVKRQKGFSLIELLIVVAIILVIAAIAIPNLMRSRQSANEASAVNSVRTLTSAEVMYAAVYPQVGYTCNLTDMGPYVGAPSEVAAGLIDGVLASGQKASYAFTLGNCNGNPATTFFVTGAPVGGGGVRKFCSSQPGVIHYDPGPGVCTDASAVLQ